MTATPAGVRAIDPFRRAPELVLASAAIVLILLEIWVLDEPHLRLARSVPGIVAGASLGFIRRRPFAAYLANGVSIIALIALGHPSDFYQWTNLIAILRASSRIAGRPAMVVLVFGWAGVVFYFLRFPDEGPAALTGAVLAIWTAAWFAGRAAFAREREVASERDRDLTRAELEVQQARLTLEEERGRIARELHDIVGHSVNVMVVHAGAGRGVVETDPGAAAQSLETIAATGRKALSDLDLMLDVLHGQAEIAPLPGLDQLEELRRSVSGTGLKVNLTVTGDPDAVGSSLGVTTYRIVQEALTNVIKHAAATKVTVRVSIGQALTITVTDDGVGGFPRPGRGLRGIEERAGLHGGTVRFGPAPGGGFQLQCRLPREAGE